MWKVVCIVIQGNKIAGYDLISDKGAKQSVTPQQLYNAIINRAVVNAAISDGRIVVKEPFQKKSSGEYFFNTIYRVGAASPNAIYGNFVR